MKKKLHLGFLVTLSGRWPRELPERRLAAYGAWVKDFFSGSQRQQGIRAAVNN